MTYIIDIVKMKKEVEKYDQIFLILLTKGK